MAHDHGKGYEEPTLGEGMRPGIPLSPGTVPTKKDDQDKTGRDQSQDGQSLGPRGGGSMWLQEPKESRTAGVLTRPLDNAT